jgi:hypothetical protein
METKKIKGFGTYVIIPDGYEAWLKNRIEKAKKLVDHTGYTYFWGHRLDGRCPEWGAPVLFMGKPNSEDNTGHNDIKVFLFDDEIENSILSSSDHRNLFGSADKIKTKLYRVRHLLKKKKLNL